MAGTIKTSNGDEYELKRAAVTASSANATPVVAAVAAKRIVVVGLLYTANAAVNVKWQSASTDLTGLDYMVQGSRTLLPPNPDGWFETAVNEALNIHLSGAVAVGGFINYYEKLPY